MLQQQAKDPGLNVGDALNLAILEEMVRDPRTTIHAGLTSRLVVRHPETDPTNIWRTKSGRRDYRRGPLHRQGHWGRHEWV